MTLKELISVTDRKTLFCVCDDLGPSNDVAELGKVPLTSLMYDLDRKVQKIYVDTDDDSLTVILEDFKDSDYPDED